MRRLLCRYVAPAALLALVLTGCSGGDPEEAAPSPTPSDSSSAPASPSEDGSSSPSPSAPTGGSADEPAAVTPSEAILKWQPVPGSVRQSVTRSTTAAGEWSLSVTEAGSSAELSGPGSSSGFADSGRRVSDALLDDEYAVVVLQDKAEERPAIARVTDLASGKTFILDGRSDVPTTNGGTWALDGGRLVHATYDGDAYCLASVDLASRESTLEWCAPERHGFSNAQVTPAGTSLLTFDAGRHPCRTVLAVDGADATPLPGAPECKAWEGMLLGDGAIWSVIPNEHQIDTAHFYARSGESYFDLGPGSSGTLVWCAGASYFVRDPQHDGDPAALMRWSADDGLAVVYESPAGQAFLDRPRCGGNTLTVTAFAQGGDEQVTAQLS